MSHAFRVEKDSIRMYSLISYTVFTIMFNGKVNSSAFLQDLFYVVLGIDHPKIKMHLIYSSSKPVQLYSVTPNIQHFFIFSKQLWFTRSVRGPVFSIIYILLSYLLKFLIDFFQYFQFLCILYYLYLL